MYNTSSRSLPVRVAKHQSKLLGFDFTVTYEPGHSTPADYGSRHPPPAKKYTPAEKESLGIEDVEEDAEIIVNRIMEVTDAITLPILEHHTEQDSQLSALMKDVMRGRLHHQPITPGYKECFEELSVKDGILLRGDRLVIPTSLRSDTLAAAHEGHPAKDSMTRQLRQTVW